MELFPDQAEVFVGEAGGDAPDVAQLALVTHDPDEQRSEERTRSARLGPAANETGVGHQAACGRFRAFVDVLRERAVFFFDPPAP